MQHILALGNDHPFMELILKCLNNDSHQRAHANEIVDCLSGMVTKYPSNYANRPEMMDQIEKYKEEKVTLLADIQQKE